MLDSPAPHFTSSTEAPARRAWIWAVAALAVLAAGLAAWQFMLPRAPAQTAAPAKAEPPPALSVAVVPVTSRSLARAVSGDGSVVAWQELLLGAEVGGLRVAEVAVEEGDHVTAGQVLVRLEDAVPAAQLAQAEAGLAEAEAALTIARADLNRAVELSRTQNTPRQVLEQRQSATRQAEARIASARAARDEAQARLGQAQLRAPFDGIVLKRGVLPGAVTAVGQEMVRLLRDGRLELDARVPELDLATIAPGQAARVIHGVREITGEVRAIAPGVTPETRLGIVHIALPPDSGLRPGMFARAEIHAEASSAIVIPQEAVVFRDGAAAAFVLEGEHVRLRRLTAGARQEGVVEVLDGLKEGERVVHRGAGFLADGDRVRLATALED
ncbi:efflux RND transporter periplasmic adaptor subunit [Roseomonas marmotae]|uniref:Efflux RND transporter periplasmic adaptor subunit n=1 Tax=Roseomonas marmotae TaxID=2768161 RepID=A0ABS3KEP9_9PROT|nr:efflux RND transporter periplasmic adaptor subunit [Roseomonas marmotae]MBO1075923.1 efflux RND transporter periplasmic adaptor subunit [Roseomonas marmotae]QTI81894.1 efflux RND transporter periplasmic adaptor subunit [Roseomonas marmotae]